MIRAYKRSKIGYWSVIALSAVIVVLLWQRDQAYPVFVPIIASALTFGIGFLAAKLLGNVLANMETTRFLGFLHMELDPAKFLNAFEPVPDRLKANTRDAAIARSYLADGYWASGQFQKALETLNAPLPEKDLALKGLYAADRCAYYLALEDTANARKAIAELTGVVEKSSTEKPELSRNLSKSLWLYQRQLDCLSEKPVELARIQEEFGTVQYNIRRLELAKLAAQTCLRENKTEAARKALEYLCENSGKTFFKTWAEQALSTVPADC